MWKSSGNGKFKRGLSNVQFFFFAPLTETGQGEVLVDLGSGGGLDVFNAARKVGASGKAIGVDMTDNMLDLSRKNAIKGGYTNVEFVRLQCYLQDASLTAAPR